MLLDPSDMVTIKKQEENNLGCTKGICFPFIFLFSPTTRVIAVA